MTDDALSRHAYVLAPKAAPHAPTLILLHGTGDSETGFAPFGRVLDPEAGLLAVRGNVDENGMARFFRRVAEGHYDLDDLRARTDDLAEFLRAALPANGVNPDDAVAVGFSNGANILASLLFHHPDIVRRAALLHPLIPFAPPAQPGLAGARVLVTGGLSDPIGPPAATRALVRYFAEQGAATEHVELRAGHTITQEEVSAVRRWLKVAADRVAA